MKKKLCFFVRHLSSSCFLNHRSYSFLTAPTTLLQSHSHLSNLPNPKPHFRIATFAFSTTTATTTKPMAIYLIERLGFSEEDSLAISKKLIRLREYSPRATQVTDLISFRKADNVITFLQEHCGFDESHFKKVITKYPLILTADVDKTIQPKVKLLQDLGFSTSELTLVLSAYPDLYLKYDLSPAIQALRDLMGSDEGVVGVFRILTRGSAASIIKNLIPNVSLLENEYGIPRDKLRKFITRTPQSLLNKTEWLRNVLVRMEDKWGISRDSTEFLRAVHLFCCVSDETMDYKCQLFRSYGWSDSDILSLIRRLPTCFGQSEAVMKKLDFYLNVLGYEPAYMASRPALLGYSLENRVVPRYRVLSILKEKGLIKATYQLYSYLLISEDRFSKTYILPYEKILPNLRDVYINRRTPSRVPLIKEA